MAATNSLDEYVYSAIERAAIEGRRCPTNPQIADDLKKSGLSKRASGGSIPTILKRLTQRGLIAIRVYGNNYRDIAILRGPHAGKTTLPPSHGGKPYVVLDQAELRRRERFRSR